MPNPLIAHLDRRVATGDSGFSATYNGGTDTTTWTIPYTVAVDGSEGTLVVALSDTATVLAGTTRPSSTTIAVSGQGDLSARPVVAGLTYRAEYTPTLPFLRDRDGTPGLTGELLLHHCDVLAAESDDIAVQVWRNGRQPREITGALPYGGLGSVRVPVHAKRSDVLLIIGDESPDTFALTGLVWQGEFLTRAKRV